MSQISRAISKTVLGGVAAAVTLGAIQFAFGSDLRGTVTADGSVAASPVNREAKGDRASVATVQNQPGQTLSFRVQGLSDTSVMMRLPVAAMKVEAFRTVAVQSKPVPQTSASQKSAVACEPPVSMLTEVAKRLQPGRCIT